MSKSVLRKKLRRLFKMADFANENKWSDQEFQDALERARTSSRRQFLKTSAAVAGGLAVATQLPACTSFGRKTFQPENDNFVLILGSGVAGLTAAYELKKAKIPFVIAEASHRIGGRIWTQFDFNYDKQFIERGGEFIDSNHHAIIDLAKELGLKLDSFPLEVKGVESELYFFDGQIYDMEALLPLVRPLVQKIKEISLEIRQSQKDFISYKTFDKFPKALIYDQMSLAGFLDTLKGQVEPWVLDLVKVAYTGEYGLDAEEQSALNIIELFDQDLQNGFSLFGDSDESKRIQGGNGKLIEALQHNLTGATPDEKIFRMRHQLQAIQEKGTKIQCIFRTPSGEEEISASRVICTIPFSILRTIDGISSLAMSPQKQKAIQEIGYGKNSKVFLSFHGRFWSNKKQRDLRSKGMIYGDFASQNFWDTSRLQKGKSGILTNFLGGKAGLACKDKTAETAMEDLEKIYKDIPEALKQKVGFQNWNLMPFHKGSYSSLLPGQYTSLWGSTEDTELGGKLLFAGEHTSMQSQGFMNGAVESGIRAAKEIVSKA